jgi:hypothetical protein
LINPTNQLVNWKGLADLKAKLESSGVTKAAQRWNKGHPMAAMES